MRISGKEYNEFWSAIGSNFYEELIDTPEDREPLDDEVLNVGRDGNLVWQGDGKMPGDHLFVRGDNGDSWLSAFRRWKKMQSIVTLIVSVPRENEAALREAVGSVVGAKVLK